MTEPGLKQRLDKDLVDEELQLDDGRSALVLAVTLHSRSTKAVDETVKEKTKTADTMSTRFYDSSRISKMIKNINWFRS